MQRRLVRRFRAPIALVVLEAFLGTLTLPFAALAAPDRSGEAPPASDVEPGAATPAPVEKGEEAPLAPGGGAQPGTWQALRSAPMAAAFAATTAAAAGAKTEVTGSSLSLPQGAGQVGGMGESFQPLLSTGGLSFTIPFALPRARGAAQPVLALQYTSGAGNGVAGQGWNLGVPNVARKTDRGVPAYVDPSATWSADADRFTYNGADLVPICKVSGATCAGALAGEVFPAWANGWWYFRLLKEGSFQRFFWSPDHKTWRVQEKSGLSIELGVPLDGSADENALERDPSYPSRIFRWNATRAYDAHGAGDPLGDAQPRPYNVVLYRYRHDGGLTYPVDLYATPPAGSPGTTAAVASFAHHVHLAWEARPDAVTSYRRGWRTTQALRLARVDVTGKPWVGGAAATRRGIRRYHLAYDPVAVPSLLTSVALEGRCGGDELTSTPEGNDGTLPETDCPRLPPVKLTYTRTDAAGRRTPEGLEPLARAVKAIANSPPEALDQGQTTFFDWNADGLPDVLVADATAFSGAHAVYLSAAGGTKDAFAPASLVGIRAVGAAPALDAYGLSLRNPNVLPSDVDGDGLVDLAYLPKGKATTLYAPALTATGRPFWQERVPASDPSRFNTIDLTTRDPDVRVVDVNGDGLVDIVRTTGLEIQTYLSLGYLPGGDGMFGHGTLTGPATATLSPEPLRTCTPTLNRPPRFQDPSVKLADMNGDGLLDLVQLGKDTAVYWPGRGDGRWGTELPAACASGTLVPNAHVTLADPPSYSTDAASLQLGDINGDGFADAAEVLSDAVVVWLNRQGVGFAAPQKVLAPIRTASPLRVRLLDVNGTGTADIVWGESRAYQYLDVAGGTRPGLLASVDNGLGAVREFTYATTVDEMLEASRKGSPWTSRVPTVAHVLKAVTVRDRLAAVGRPAGAYATEYTYRDPYYDARERSFRGFRSAVTRNPGDATNPTTITETSFLVGECAEDGVPGRCLPSGRFYENPRDVLAGNVRIIEQRSEAGVVRSTAHSTYTLRALYRGLDGRVVYHAYESAGDEWVYDTAAFDRAAVTATVSELALEGLGGAAPVTTSGSVKLAATSGRVRVRKASQVDAFGNAQTATAFGCVEGCATGDESITTTVRYERPAGETSGWLWRPVRTYVTGGASPDRRRAERSTRFDRLGRAVATYAELTGTLPLERFHEQPGAAVAPLPAGASVDGTIQTGATEYDAYGQASFERGPSERCRKLVRDPAYEELVATEIVYGGGLGANGCGTLAFGSTGQYDRGLQQLLVRTGVNGEDARVVLDGFGRVREVYAPDPDTVGKPSPLPSILYEYTLPPDPAATPYVVVRTRVHDGRTPADASYRDTWTFTDGLGRELATITQADPSAGDGGAWVVGGVNQFDARGKASRVYEPFFWDGVPIAYPLGLVPTTASRTERVDAFGRVTDRYALDGSLVLHLDFHALSIDTWDAEDLRAGGRHHGTYATGYTDGHGRPVREVERYREAGALLARETRTEFLPTGEPSSITHLSGKPGADAVVRRLVHDSLGRLVLNVEPNTSVGAAGPASSAKAYRYAYNDAGDRVGWSDARGCGSNLFYDAAGRLVAEDYSPCLASHAPWSAPDLRTGEGAEVFHRYDEAGEDGKALADAGCPIRGDTLRGRLVVTRSRGDTSATNVDGRGRVLCTARRVARPDAPGYATRWYTRRASYDGADRVVSTTTGARSPEFLGAGGESRIDHEYGRHGGLVAAGSSYGPLVARIEREADGLPHRRVYGDAAATETLYGYDARRRLSTARTARGTPPVWAGPTYPRPQVGTRPSQQLVLEDGEIRYDAADNPVALLDRRDASAWPESAKPVSRAVEYDDFYRVTRVGYTYAGGADAWRSPLEPEQTTSSPARALASPHVAFPTRVQEESFAFDGLGNLARSGDDLGGFYDRSLGTVTHGTAADGPFQLRHAELPGPRGGSLDTSHDPAGNITGLVLRRDGACLPAGAFCTQRFAYEWDEVGRLARARRWDLASGERTEHGTTSGPLPARTPDAELRYAYDGADGRVLKTARDERGLERHTLYVFGSLDVRRTEWLPADDDYRLGVDTEVPYLIVDGSRLARVVYGDEDLPSVSRGRQHVFLELGDHLGSTSIVLDHATGELVERATYTAFGQAESDYRPERWGSFREDYRFTGKEDDIEVGLQYFGKRYYAPALQQWLSPDPLAVHSLMGDANVYAYVHGRALRAVDPDGQCELICLMIIGAVVGAAYNAASTYLTQGPAAVSWVTLASGAAGGVAGAVGGVVLGPVIGPAFAFLGPYGAPMASSTAGAVLGKAVERGTEAGARPGAGVGDVLSSMFNPAAMAMDAALGALVGMAYKAGSDLVTRTVEATAPKPSAAPNAAPPTPNGGGGTANAPVQATPPPAEAAELANIRSHGRPMPALQAGLDPAPRSGGPQTPWWKKLPERLDGAPHPEARPRWKVGDDPWRPTASGNEPSWTTVRQRHWKNTAAAPDAVEVWGSENVERMRKGLAPQRFNPDKGAMESMELSHEPVPARDGGKAYVPRWPQDHAAVDPYRRPGY